MLQRFVNASKKWNTLYIIGQVLAFIFNGRMGFVAILLKEIDAARQPGRCLINLFY